MQFDLFHSVGRVDTHDFQRSDLSVFKDFIDQARLAEALRFRTVWVAESHFSSEVQKRNRGAVIPNYKGEVGLNCDSPQLFHFLKSKTHSIGFGTAIFNIVGGNGGPIGAADRVRSMIFLNHLDDNPRTIFLGIASGRFPYINRPYGIVPRNAEEEMNWKDTQRFIFIEALEIFLRLLTGETIGSADLTFREILGKNYLNRWDFEPLKIVPDLHKNWLKTTRIVLGSSDPLAREHALRFFDVDIFNLSFTPPENIEKLHMEMEQYYTSKGKSWSRSRMPRTVLTFIDQNHKKAEALASNCFDTYIEAMRGTVALPPKKELLKAALIGDPVAIREQLSTDTKHGFKSEDRLMLWFEFNQHDSDAIQTQMRLFSEKVMPFMES